MMLKNKKEILLYSIGKEESEDENQMYTVAERNGKTLSPGIGKVDYTDDHHNHYPPSSIPTNGRLLILVLNQFYE